MTTIAYRKGILAADSQVTFGGDASGAIKGTCQKLFRKTIKSGRKTRTVILATAGESSPGMVFVDWYGTGGARPDLLKDTDFTCLVLEPDGLYEVDSLCRPERILAPFYAIGSGAKAALAAMHCGKSAREAVAIAAKLDPYTGGRIVSMRL